MIFAAGVIVSFLVYLIIGTVIGRRVQSQSDYYVAGRNAPTILVTGSLVASFLSTVSFMGELGFSYDGYPMILMILVAVNVTGYILGVLLFGRYLRRSESLTVPEFFGRRFNSKSLQAIAGITVVIGIGAYLVAVTQGVSLLVSDLLGVNFVIALLIVWAAYTSFTFFSGSPGVLLTDTIMFIIFMFAGILGHSYMIAQAGGPAAALEKLSNIEGKPGITTWHGLTGPNAYMGSPTEALIWALILGVVWATVVAISPWQSSRYLMAKNEHVALRAGFMATAAVLFLYIFQSFGGATINIFKADIEPSEIAFIWAAQNALPTWLGVLIVTGIAAAGLSSASTFLSLTGFSTAHDIAPIFMQGRRARAANDQNQQRAALRFSRIVMLFMGLVVLVVTLVSPPAVFEIGYFAATLFAASWGPVAIMCIFSERITARGAIVGMVAGFGTVFILEAMTTFGGLTLPIYLEPALVGFAACFLGIFAGGLGQEASSQGIEFRRSITSVPEEDRDPGRVRTTLRFGLVTAGVCGIVILILFLTYFLPYSEMVASR